ncbi:protein of unknown function [Paraburkholderia kururiensis]
MRDRCRKARRAVQRKEQATRDAAGWRRDREPPGAGDGGGSVPRHPGSNASAAARRSVFRTRYAACVRKTERAAHKARGSLRCING